MLNIWQEGHSATHSCLKRDMLSEPFSYESFEKGLQVVILLINQWHAEPRGFHVLIERWTHYPSGFPNGTFYGEKICIYVWRLLSRDTFNWVAKWSINNMNVKHGKTADDALTNQMYPLTTSEDSTTLHIYCGHTHLGFDSVDQKELVSNMRSLEIFHKWKLGLILRNVVHVRCRYFKIH